jgi:hypothetical protein
MKSHKGKRPLEFCVPKTVYITATEFQYSRMSQYRSKKYNSRIWTDICGWEWSPFTGSPECGNPVLFHKTWEICWLAERRLVSQKEFFYIELVVVLWPKWLVSSVLYMQVASVTTYPISRQKVFHIKFPFKDKCVVTALVLFTALNTKFWVSELCSLYRTYIL